METDSCPPNNITVGRSAPSAKMDSIENSVMSQKQSYNVMALNKDSTEQKSVIVQARKQNVANIKKREQIQRDHQNVIQKRDKQKKKLGWKRENVRRYEKNWNLANFGNRHKITRILIKISENPGFEKQKNINKINKITKNNNKIL